MLYTLVAEVVREGDLYIAASKEFMVTGRGSTPQEACEELGEGIALLLDTVGKEEAEKYLSRLEQVPLPRVRRKHNIDLSLATSTSPITSELELAYA